MPFVFDAYNIYHCAKKMLENWAEITPVSLCEYIADDMRYLRQDGVMVFDGCRQNHWPMEVEPRGFLDIVYSGSDSDADSMIEYLIEQYTVPKRLAVVSSDRRLRRAARRVKAESISAQEYLIGLVRRNERPKAPPKEPKGKRAGLNNGELSQWLEVFGIEDDDSPPDITDLIK